MEWEEELVRHMDIMYPEVPNKEKRYHMYRHMLRKLHGHFGKGNQKPLPPCFQQGLRDLFPSEEYVGFRENNFDSGLCGDWMESVGKK